MMVRSNRLGFLAAFLGLMLPVVAAAEPTARVVEPAGYVTGG